MLIELALRQCFLRKQNANGTITPGEMVELIGIGQILDSL